MKHRELVSETPFRHFPEATWPPAERRGTVYAKGSLAASFNQFLDSLPEDAIIAAPPECITASWARMAVECDVIPEDEESDEEEPLEACGCPTSIVRDEGHQEGCAERWAGDEG